MAFAIAGPQVVQSKYADRQGKKPLISDHKSIMASEASDLRTLQRPLRPRKVHLGRGRCVRCFFEVALLKKIQKILGSLYGHRSSLEAHP